MRRFALLTALIAAAVSAAAQQPKLKLDSLGLPPLPGGTNVGHIRLPLTEILKPEPGQKATGPKLIELAINTYRVPLTITNEQIVEFYKKYAAEGGWRLLDDLQEGPTNRSLVFWSPKAPGYLTIDLVPGPEDTRQVDLTRLLGEVDPSRPGETFKLTGKRVRFQRVSATIAGVFQHRTTGVVNQQNLTMVEGLSESGLGPADAVRSALLDQSYAVAIKVVDQTRQMSKVEVFSGNNTLLAESQSARPTDRFNLVAKVRATQGLALRVVISGPDPNAQKPAPAAQPAPKPAAPSRPIATRQSPSVRPGTPAQPAQATAPAPPVPTIVLTEYSTLRPPRTALPEARRGTSTTKMETITLVKDEDLGSSCDGNISREVPWKGEVTDHFTFSPDLFQPMFPRMNTGARSGSITVSFTKGSGTNNYYSLTQTKVLTTTVVQVGYVYAGQFVTLPQDAPNPVSTNYEVVNLGQPVLSKRSAGICPPVARPTPTPSDTQTPPESPG